MKARLVLLGAIVLVAAFASLTTAAQGTQPLRVHFVAADNSGAASDAKLKEFLPLLRKNLPFDSFRLISLKKTTLKEQRMSLAGGYDLSLNELENTSLSVELRKGEERLLKTRLTLRPEKPVILGGFSYDKDRALLIIVMDK